MEEEIAEESGAAERSKMPLMWVPTKHMVADGLTKRMDNATLRQAIAQGSLAIQESEPDARDREPEAGWVTQWSRWTLGRECYIDLASDPADVPTWLR